MSHVRLHPNIAQNLSPREELEAGKEEAEAANYLLGPPHFVGPGLGLWMLLLNNIFFVIVKMTAIKDKDFLKKKT